MIALHRILVPTDCDDCSTATVRYAAGLAEKFAAELILLNVVQDLALAMPDAVMPTPVPAPVVTELIEAASNGLANLVKAENLERLRPRLEVRVGSPAAEIIQAASDLKADLVCIGTHGRGGIAHLLLGSVAEKVVRQAPCPVLTIRPHAGQTT
jgi:nucleotide-binding universal stress UspA family protein